jgi:hypothetical protein
MRRYAIAAALGLAAAGCSGDRPVPVAGRVTLDGADLAQGEIQFVPDDPARGPEAGPVTNGRFELAARPGKHKVRVTAAKSTGFKGGFEYFESIVPARYNDATELTADVPAGGSRELKFELRSDKR